MLRFAPSFGEQVSRHDLVRSPHVWFALCSTFGVLALSCGFLSFVMPGITPAHLRIVAIVLLLTTAMLTLSRSPKPDTAGAHGLLALLYIGPAFSMWGFAPGGAACVATAMFIGPLVAMWTTRRSHQILHLVAASIVLLIPPALGVTDQSTLIACLALIPAVWILSACVSVVLEACERQGARLAVLMRRDPLTGLGNRRLLDERLADATNPQQAQPFTLLTLDLNGFKALNDTLGHAAGDQLLQNVGRALQTATAGDAEVFRQGGDEFAVLAPEASAAETDALAHRITASLARVHVEGRGGAVSTGIGVAQFPIDGTDAPQLLEVADERLRVRKADARHERQEQTTKRQLPPVSQPAALRDDVPTPPPTAEQTQHEAALAASEEGVGRVELADHMTVWRFMAAMYLIYAAIGVGILEWAPSLPGPAFPFVVAFGGLTGLVLLFYRPPALDTRANHAIVALSYVIPALILITCQPGGAPAIGCLIFVGPLAATRFVRRRDIAAHLSIASLTLLAMIPSGLVDPTAVIAILILVGAMWVLGVCSAIVLEAAEAQTLALRSLVGRDALTGAGNRRGLDDLLTRELRHGGARAGGLSVLTLDFNGFKALNDTVGHGAGDVLLVEAAAALEQAALPGEEVFRQGGDEFCIVRTGGPREPRARRIAAFREALATVDCNGKPLTTGVGWANAPADGTTPAALLHAADTRLLADKQATPGSAARDAAAPGSRAVA